MIIGISGKARSGKDTIANMIVAKGYIKVALADEIKRSARRWFGFTNQQLWGPSEFRDEPPPGKDGPTARKACQFIGTEVARELYPDVWVDYLLNIYRQLTLGHPKAANSAYEYSPYLGLRVVDGWQRPPLGVVVSDVRYTNEMNAIKDAGGLLVRVYRDGAQATGDAANHPSETEQDNIPDNAFHAIIENNHSFEELENQVGMLLEQYEER